MSSGPSRTVAELATELDLVEAKAWEALGRYKFGVFGHFASIWVHLNRLGNFKRANPWRDLVVAARANIAPAVAAPIPLFTDQPTEDAAA